MKASGATGELRSGYRRVARLSGWTFDGDRIEAVALDVNTFDLEHGTLDVALAVGRQEWVWRDIAPIVDGARFAATVHGKPEITR